MSEKPTTDEILAAIDAGRFKTPADVADWIIETRDATKEERAGCGPSLEERRSQALRRGELELWAVSR